MKYYTVGQINQYIKNVLSQDYFLKKLVVRGELSNVKYHSLGHIYFSLKDETGSIPAVMFKGNTGNLKFKLENGKSVFVSGYVDVFERDGKYQFYAREIIEEGMGDLAKRFEELKAKLNEEGLFDPDHRKAIPPYPKNIGVVSASTGAAIQDIINVSRRRNPYVQLILCPAKVQGEGAAESVARGIKRLDEMGLDLIIVARGGGSMEDLWAFNEEAVVRAIYDAKTPIITGIGHEIDVTLADYAADKRASTPSQAAEYAVFDVMTEVNLLRAKRLRIAQAMELKLKTVRLKLMNKANAIEALSPERRLRNRQQELASYYDRMRHATERKFDRMKNRLEVCTAKLDALRPSAKLVGGFGYVEVGDEALTDIDRVKKGDELKVTVKGGSLKAVVSEVNRDE
ncbi:MAG: exodeoxyribonuclease VII large subunit [Lachnospiraceae bacterium]|nr:exodeoxyribonuclease VII large subunit [Lachnospiraceae bacterium]